MKKNLELVKAEQQLVGFVHGYQGYSIIELVDAMGLSSDEWQTLKTDMEWLPSDLKTEIDSYFQASPSRRIACIQKVPHVRN